MNDIPQTAQRDERGRMLAPLPGGAPKITTDTARSMVAKRVEKYRRAAIQRIVKEAQSVDPTVSVGADAFGLVASKQFVALLDSDKPAVEQLQKLGQIMTGQTAENSRRENAAVPPGVIVAQPAALLDLFAQLDAARQAAVDKARSSDAIPADGATDTRNENAETVE